ncbi:hypothetical protein IFM89_000488 [Coptis chinensis]|uniref:Uncharacterized protein n=1 Tax=Coptis chinensis TaxID=261450 RepID=A0A835H3K4_9MAGN|nr:hypothetical protein IFM89_000488 [Coptis chinensis]
MDSLRCCCSFILQNPINNAWVQYEFLLSTLAFTLIGAGWIRPCSVELRFYPLTEKLAESSGSLKKIQPVGFTNMDQNFKLGFTVVEIFRNSAMVFRPHPKKNERVNIGGILVFKIMKVEEGMTLDMQASNKSFFIITVV